jgi:spermidine/putrescine transport system permease protein
VNATGWKARVGLLGPGLTWWLLFLAVPLALVVVTSFAQRGQFGGVEYAFTLENYRRAVDPLFIGVLLFSLRVAFIATAIALLIGYPTAYFIATRGPRWRIMLLALVVLPFWTNFLIRTYAWIVLLNREGLINRALGGMGVIDAPLELLNNTFAIIVGLTYAFLPLMILPIYASIERLPGHLREAAGDLGANRVRTFLTVTLPLTMPGVVAGCIFVFVPTLGNYIVPDLLGGGRRVMIGNLIEQQFLDARDWPFGSVLALALMLVMTLLLLLQGWAISREKRLTDGR